MRRLILALVCIAACVSREQPDPNVAHANAVLADQPIIDGHNDLPWAIRQDTIARKDVEKYDLRTHARGHTDLARLKSGHVGAQFWSVYIPGDSGAYGYAKMQAEQIAIAKAVVAKYPDAFKWALTAAEIRAAIKEGKVGSLMGVEGGHAIENSLDSLRSYYAQGARYMTLTHNVTLDWADAAADSARHGGLTPFGESVVREMNKLGMLVDLSHVSPATMSDALNVTKAPVIFSHSSARALTEHVRNVPDSILARLPANGGVVMVTFVPAFVSQAVADHQRAQTAARTEIAKRAGLDSAGRAAATKAWDDANPAPRATLAQVADHIEHIRHMAGIDHVGIGSDFDGIDQVVVGLEDVSTFPNLFAELIRRGWTDEELKKLAGENLLRALERAEAAAAGSR
ncbi:MAG TPA: dipeptidase [Gemmatimonadaceae bacterium]|nr:dipeptidase [Gemmatimonadaceae bacterium]